MVLADERRAGVVLALHHKYIASSCYPKRAYTFFRAGEKGEALQLPLPGSCTKKGSRTLGSLLGSGGTRRDGKDVEGGFPLFSNLVGQRSWPVWGSPAGKERRHVGILLQLLGPRAHLPVQGV